MSNSNVLIHGRAPGNQKLSIRCDEDGLLFTDTQVRDQYGNYIVINADGSVNSRMIGKNYVNDEFKILNVDNSGNLTTNIRASGENLTSENGALNVNIKNANVDISGTIDIGNWPTIYDVSGNVDVSGTVNALIDNINSSILIYGDDYTGTDTHNALYVDANGFISTNVLEAKHDNVIYDLEISKSNLTFGSGNDWVRNPFSEQNGWYFTNNTTSNLGYLYWYNNGDYSTIMSFPTQADIRYNELDIFYSIIGLYDVNYKPKMIVYSKPTGSGDYLVGVAHSVWEFTINSGAVLNTGENILIYYGNTARIKTNDTEVRRVELTLSATYGQALNTEVIGHIFLRTYSTPSANNYKLNVVECGLYHKQVGLLEYYFDNSIRRIADDKLNKLTYNSSSYLYCDISGQRVISDISGQRVDISGQRVVCDISGQMVDISGQRVICDISGQRVDISGQRVISDISGQRVDISGQRVDISGQRIISDISGQRVDISGQRVDIGGQTINVNTISNFSLETGGNLASIKTNSDKFKFVGDDLKAIISNTSFESKLRDGNNNIITSTAYGIDGVRGLDVSIKNATQAEPLVVEIPTTNTINTFSTNLPVSYEITAGGYLSSAAGGLNVNLRNTDGNAIGITGTPLVVESNLITGYALESGGNLASIKTNTDKFKFTGNYLSCEVVNAGTNSLSVSETNPLTNYALETGGNLASVKTNTDKFKFTGDNLNVNVAAGSISVSSVNIKDSAGNNLNSTSNALNSYITNSSLDTRCFGSNDGTTFYPLKTTTGGNLITESKTQDGAGTAITSTLNSPSKQSLDVNLTNNNSIKVDISGSTIVDGKIAVFDANAYPFIERISVGAGADILTFSFGNLYSNITVNAGAFSSTLTITSGGYGRRAMVIYRDNATSSTDSISYYTNSNFGTATGLLLATTYPIVNNGYRWSNVILNILPFSSIYLRNDSATINNTGVYLTIVGV